MEHIELIMKPAPVHNVVYWSRFHFFLYKSKKHRIIRKSLSIKIKNGASFLFLRICSIMTRNKVELLNNIAIFDILLVYAMKLNIDYMKNL